MFYSWLKYAPFKYPATFVFGLIRARSSESQLSLLVSSCLSVSCVRGIALLLYKGPVEVVCAVCSRNNQDANVDCTVSFLLLASYY